jgi:hypothetical protein
VFGIHDIIFAKHVILMEGYVCISRALSYAVSHIASGWSEVTVQSLQAEVDCLIRLCQYIQIGFIF